MRTTEGAGLVAPIPVRVPIGNGDRAWAWLEAKKRAEYRDYVHKSSPWARGLFGDDPRHAIYVGFLGELAFSRWVTPIVGYAVEVDLAPRLGGDGGVDFTILGHGIQVKAAKADYGELLVRTDHAADPEWEFIVRAQYPTRRHVAINGIWGRESARDTSCVELCGWSTLDNFLRLSTVEPSRCSKSNHQNYVLPPQRFQPMRDLSDFFAAELLKESPRCR